MPGIAEELLALREEGGALGLLAETIDRALMIEQSEFRGGEGAIRFEEIAQWADEIRSGTRLRGVGKFFDTNTATVSMNIGNK